MGLGYYEHNFEHPLSFDKLKMELIKYYYPGISEDDLISQIKSRDFIVTPVINNYGCVGTVILSFNGSPPKGEAIIKDIEYLNSKIVLIGNGRSSRMFQPVLNKNFFNEIKNLIHSKNCKLRFEG